VARTGGQPVTSRRHARAPWALTLVVAAVLGGCAGGSSAPPATGRPAPAPGAAVVAPATSALREFPVPAGSGPHDVAPAADGTVWFTAQRAGWLGRLDPATGVVRQVPLGPGSAPHGVIVGPDGAPWVTDGGQNAIVRVDPATLAVRRFPLPPGRPRAGLNTAVFDRRGALWFTGESGVVGRLDVASGRIQVVDVPRGPSPYGIAATPDGTVWFASLAAGYVGRVDPATGSVTVEQPPTPGQGARRIWPDSRGRLWVSEWNAGQVAELDPAHGAWREWRLPGAHPRAYAVYVDDRDTVWLSDWGANALVGLDPATGAFTSYPLPAHPGNVRQILGRHGEVWAAESAADRLVVLRT
jgi:virginiamycin B lyase